MNAARCSSTGQTAAYLTFGRELRTTDDAHRDLRAIVENENFVSEILPQLRMMEAALRQAREVHEMTEDQKKERADRVRRDPPVYKPGDLVLITSHTLSNSAKDVSAKLNPRRDGPYEVKRRVGPVSYEITCGDGTTTHQAIYHVSAITPFRAEAGPTPVPVRLIRRRRRPRKNVLAPGPSDVATSPDSALLQLTFSIS